MTKIGLSQKVLRKKKEANEYLWMEIQSTVKIFEEENITFQNKFLQVPANVCNGIIFVQLALWTVK